jgi:hypothetical protein
VFACWSTKKKDRKALHLHAGCQDFCNILLRTVLGNEQLIITGVAVIVVAVNIVTLVVLLSLSLLLIVG